MKKRFTDEQRIRILREAEAGKPVKEVIRDHNISEQTFYKWKKKYEDMNPSDAGALKLLKAENIRLKKKLAESILEIDMLKEINSKKW